MIDERVLRVLDGLDLRGRMNLPDAETLAHVQHSIRLGYPQVQRVGVQPGRIALVGSGPSLDDTEDDLVQLVHAGAKLVTLNGAYQWCLDRHLKPSAQIVLDARASNARFLTTEVPGCRYYLASQCHPDVWAAVEGRPHVGIFHAVGDGTDQALRDTLDTFYLKKWQGIAGGTTAATRAIGLLRALGYLRFDLFGIDCCWRGDVHHAFPQAENEGDRRCRVVLAPTDDPTAERVFTCSPWHVKQFEDFLQMIRMMSDHFLLAVHGDGMLAYGIRTCADLQAIDEVTG